MELALQFLFYAIGKETHANGVYSTAIGNSTTASGLMLPQWVRGQLPAEIIQPLWVMVLGPIGF